MSQSTVSHVVNGTRVIAPETEAKVWQSIRGLGYVHDSIARSLRTGSTATIGLAISAISNPYFAEVVSAIEQQVAARGRTMLLIDTHDDSEREYLAIQELIARRCDGIILAPSADPTATFELLQRRGMPTVLVDRIPDRGGLLADAVGVENIEPVAELVDHLVLRGHRRIAFVAGRPGLGTSVERLQGHRLGLSRNGLSDDPELTVVGGSDEESSCAAVLQLLRLAERPTAIVTGNNAMTIGAMRALSMQGLDVPDQMGLVGYDDFPWAALFAPRLTVVAQPLTELGTRAAELLEQRIADPALPPREVRLPAQVTMRDSAGRGPHS